MKVDKANGSVKYNDEFHKYWIGDETNTCISVTTLIHKYCMPFDSDFWSSYKALEALVDKETFAVHKKVLLARKKFDMSLLERTGISELAFILKKNEILDGYSKANKEGCERGTKIHSEMENQYYKSRTHTLEKFNLGGQFKCTKDNYCLDDDKGIFPEYLVYRVSPDGVMKVAGQIDLLIKDGNDIYIVDYKTNKKLNTKSFFDSATKKNQMMIYPLNNLMDCNMVHYQLQLSTYAWMIKQMNPNFVIKGLTIIHFDHDGGIKSYDLNYLEEDVKRMLVHYKKQLLIQNEKARNTPVAF